IFAHNSGLFIYLCTKGIIFKMNGSEKIEKLPDETITKMSEINLKKAKKLERQQKRASESTKIDQEDCSKGLYSTLELNQSNDRPRNLYTKIVDIDEKYACKNVRIRGRVQTTRGFAKNGFIVLRQGESTLQCFLSVSTTISKQMVKFCIGIPKESIVDMYGKINTVDNKVLSCTVNDFELHIHEIHIVSKAHAQLPLLIEDASRNESDLLSTVNQDTRLDHRVIDLRTFTNHAIFKLQAAVCSLFREFLDKNGFVELHFPKIIGTASEGGGNFFKVDYFNRPAYLAQSPQLYKQMAINADFDRVYTIGSVFRAEDSNTHRHLCEFVGLDIEMAFDEHYHEVVEMIGRLLIYIFNQLKKRYQPLLEIVRDQYPSTDFMYTEEPLILKYQTGIEMLNEVGIEVGDLEDLSTPNEKLLGKLVRDKYQTDFYILDKYPLKVRPFYTMPDPYDYNFSNSYDMFMRGEEILSGAQRVHDVDLLTERAIAHNIDLKKISSYLNSFRYGAPPHAGGGIGLERFLSFYLDLGNVRKTSMFPRDPKRLDP
ncbi:hypothetical protein HZS_3394, partial [Henneguya salminicola]